MTNIISLVSQKGGVGKSTMARAIATYYTKQGLSVKIADMDINQSTSHRWQQRRLQSEIEPAVSVECFGTVSQAIKHSESYDVIIFDGAPQASKTTRDIAMVSRLIVIPTGLSVDDMEPSVILANTLCEKGTPDSKIAFALCRTGDSKNELKEAREYLESTPYILLDGQMTEKTAFRRAQDEGRSAIECRYKAPREQATRLIKAIDDIL